MTSVMPRPARCEDEPTTVLLPTRAPVVDASSPPKAPPTSATASEGGGPHDVGWEAAKGGEVPNDFVVPKGSAKKGDKYFKKYCRQCHSVYPDNRITGAGSTQLGPTMFNVYGRASGVEDIQNKCADERVEQVLWTDGPLMNYMRNPRVMAAGRVQMNFPGIKDFQTRVDIVHYLRTLDYSNPTVAEPEEKPSSFAPLRWAQRIRESQ